jgi:tRNA threonylcarbamoyladenosine modification (KEOPS) complex Cgi121 subunit
MLGGVDVQFFDAGLVAGWEHLYFSALNALNAFKSGRNVSRSLPVECLLFACARGQIREAFNVIGVKPGLSRVAVLVVADGKEDAEKALKVAAGLVGDVRDDEVLELSDEKLTGVKRAFGISGVELGAESGEDGERKALSDLVLEHVALLAAER